MPFRLPFELGVAHYDPPPPERLQRGDGRVNATKVGYGPASIAFAPVVMPDLRPEPELGPGWARFVQSAGGIVGFPVPHRVRHEPYVQIRGPVAWTTLALTIHADGTVDPAGGQERLHRPRGLVAGRPTAPTRLG
jgi:hypothetical protein